MPTKDNLTVIENGDGRGGKGDGAAGIAELAHGEERGRSQGRDNVNVTGGGG